MSNASDMSTPVTRGELKEELQRFREDLVTKAELHDLGQVLLTRIEAGERRLIESLTERVTERVTEHVTTLVNDAEQRLHVDLAQHAKTLYESMAALLSASQERYAGLPERVSRLEAAVFTSERAGGRRRRARQR